MLTFIDSNPVPIEKVYEQWKKFGPDIPADKFVKQFGRGITGLKREVDIFSFITKDRNFPIMLAFRKMAIDGTVEETCSLEITASKEKFFFRIDLDEGRQNRGFGKVVLANMVGFNKISTTIKRIEIYAGGLIGGAVWPMMGAMLEPESAPMLQNTIKNRLQKSKSEIKKVRGGEGAIKIIESFIAEPTTEGLWAIIDSPLKIKPKEIPKGVTPDENGEISLGMLMFAGTLYSAYFDLDPKSQSMTRFNEHVLPKLRELAAKETFWRK